MLRTFRAWLSSLPAAARKRCRFESEPHTDFDVPPPKLPVDLPDEHHTL